MQRVYNLNDLVNLLPKILIRFKKGRNHQKGFNNTVIICKNLSVNAVPNGNIIRVSLVVGVSRVSICIRANPDYNMPEFVIKNNANISIHRIVYYLKKYLQI